MKSNIRLVAAFVLVAASFFFAGALSDPVVVSVADALRYRAGNERNYAEWFGPNMGAYSPVAEAYFKGRAEGLEVARNILLEANGNP